MSTVSSLKAAPWNDFDPTVLASADPVPTMLKQDERQMYFWLARDYVQDTGTVVDLGAYVGGSTACLAAGLKAGGHTCDLHAYDRFEIHNDARKQRLLSLGVPAFDGSDVLPAIQKMLSPWINQVHLHPGDIREKGWGGDPIEILIVDAAKHADTGDHIAETFFPHLIPGRSLVVHQDFLNHRQPWIAAQMALFAEYFEPLVLCGQECIVFLNTAPIPKSMIAESKVDPLNNAAYLRALRQISERLEPMVGQRPLRRIRDTAKAHPNIRNAHKLTRALRRAAE